MAKLKKAVIGNIPAGNPKQAKSPNPNLPTEIHTERPRKPTARKEIPLDALIAYRMQGLSYQEIASIVGCCWQNVQIRLNDADYNGLEYFRKNKDHCLENLQYKFIALLSAGQIKTMIDKRGLTDFGILEDKIRAIRGQNDSNIKPMVMIVRGDANIQIAVDRPIDKCISQPLSNTGKDLCKLTNDVSC